MELQRTLKMDKTIRRTMKKEGIPQKMTFNTFP
jgi:hypothetical protein